MMESGQFQPGSMATLRVETHTPSRDSSPTCQTAFKPRLITRRRAHSRYARSRACAQGPGFFMERFRGYVPGIFRHPVGGGLAAIAIIAVVILFVGTEILSNDFLEGVDRQQSRQIAHLSETLHYSGILSGDRSSAGEELSEVADSPTFDRFIRQAIFGLDIARLDLYDLNGNRLYSTDTASSPEPTGGDTPFTEARRGVTTSEVRNDALISNAAGQIRTTDVLATYGLIEDKAPDDPRGGRPLAVISIYGEIGRSLDSIRTTIWYIVGVFFGGLAIIFFIVYRVSEASRKRLQDANDLLQQQYTAVKESRERMLAADEAAKRAIAEELHGAVQTKLYAVWMKLGAAAQEIRDSAADQDQIVDAIATEVDNIREEDIRQLSHRLHPGIVRVSALAGLRSLRDYYEQLIPIELNIGPEAEALEQAGSSEIPEKLRLAAYRITELALGNVLKHAGAASAAIGWDYRPGEAELVLTISDDGLAFDESNVSTAAEATGIGLTTINDYADALGGSLDINSRPGEGTRVTVRFPYRQTGSDHSGGGTIAEEAPNGGSAEPASTVQELAHNAGSLAEESGSD